MKTTTGLPLAALLAGSVLTFGLAQASPADPAPPQPAAAGAAVSQAAPAAAQEHSAGPGRAVLKAHVAVLPDQVNWGDCPPVLPPGAKCAVTEGDPAAAALFALRIRMPDGYRIAPHFHPADEHVVVLAGVFNMGRGDTFDTSAGHALPVGGFMAMPAGEHHYAWATGTTDLHIYAIGPWGLTYVNPQDDPRGPPAGN